MDSHDKKLDESLDNALADYSNVEPRAGIENRIIARLKAEDAVPGEKAWLHWWPAWGLVAAAVIALVAWFAISPTHKQHPDVVVKQPPKEVPQVQSLPAPERIARTATPPAARPRRTSHYVGGVEPAKLAVVKQDVFPAPSPLTDQEKMLFAYLRHTAPAEIAANAKPDDDPVLNPQLNEVLPQQKNVDRNANLR